MSREILFRGKTKKGEWVKGGTWEKPVYDDFYIIDHNGVCYIIDPETRGESSGMTDKNGTKIFEGDVVIDQWGEKGICVFMDGSFRFKDPQREAYADARDWPLPIIIGNIHDNKELINEQ